MSSKELRVAVVGAGRWAERAHIPGWQRDPRVEVVALADTDAEVLGRVAAEFGVERAAHRLPRAARRPVHRRDRRGHRQRGALRDLVGRARGRQARAVREAGAPRLRGRPSAPPSWPVSKGLKTKLGFTFRYAPAVLYAKDLIDAGFVGEPYIFNGYEQNSQWIDPATPMRQVEARRRTRPGDHDLVHRGLRRPDHRHHALVERPPAGSRRRHDAQLRARADGPRHRRRCSG